MENITKKGINLGRVILAIFIAFVVLGLAIKILPPSINIIVIILFSFLGIGGEEFLRNADAIGNILGLAGSVYLTYKTYKSISGKK